MYKRPEDQYSIPAAPGMIKQLKEEEEQRKKLETCKGSTVRSYSKLDFQGSLHAGTLSHQCSLKKEHEGWCECACGCRFANIGA